MLVYHPAFDLYHGIFRALLILEHAPGRSIPVDTLRIVDLYFLFPYLLAELDFPKGTGAKGRQLAGSRSRFNTLPSPRIFLAQIKGLHTLVTAALAGQELVSVEALRAGTVSRTNKIVPAGLFAQATTEDVELAKYLGSKIAPVPLLGKRGLKDRSKLMEFRYDPA